MAKFTNELNNYQNIPRNLVFDTNLSDRARFVYCFMACKPNDWDFYLEPMAKEIGYSVDTLRKYINELVESGWLEKGEQEREKGTFGAVSYTLKATKNTDTENFRHGENPTQHNIDYRHKRDGINKEKEDNKLSSKKKFCFKQALLDLGVCESVVNDFLLVRKNKKATNSETAFNRIKNEIAKSGLTANECITIAVEHSWQGFSAEWVNKTRTQGKADFFRGYTPQKISDRADDYLRTLKVGIKFEQDGVKYLKDDTFISNGKRYYRNKFGNLVEVPIGLVARPNENWEYNKNNMAWVQDERTMTTDDFML